MKNKNQKIERYMAGLNEAGLKQALRFMLQSNRDNKGYILHQVEDYAIMYPELS